VALLEFTLLIAQLYALHIELDQADRKSYEEKAEG